MSEKSPEGLKNYETWKSDWFAETHRVSGV